MAITGMGSRENSQSDLMADSCPLWDMLVKEVGSERIRLRNFRDAMEDRGFDIKKDPRLAEVLRIAEMLDLDDLTKETFDKMVAPARQLLTNAFHNRLAIPEFYKFSKVMDGLYKDSMVCTSGENAQYIPELAQADPKLWAVAFVSVDGQVYEKGDTNHTFSAQSTTKVVSYLVAMQDLGEDVVHRFIGREPSGRNFNEMCLNFENCPHNPYINSGAIMTCSLLGHRQNSGDRFRQINSYWKRLTANSPTLGFSNETYLSEKTTANRNFCLGYLMNEKAAFAKGNDAAAPHREWSDHQDLSATLDLYFQTCSISVSCHDMAMVAACLANGGVNPVTDERIFDAKNVRNALSLMLSCGMYDYSGEWAFKIGLPAKSGVSGVVIGIAPNVGGFASFSPPLDSVGNSARGVHFFTELVKKYPLHYYDRASQPDQNTAELPDPSLRKSNQYEDLLVAVNYACKDGDLAAVQGLVACGVNLNGHDYDGRSPLHLACSEGHVDVVKYLLAKKVDVNTVDRFMATALDDAQRVGAQAVVDLVLAAGGKNGKDMSPQAN